MGLNRYFDGLPCPAGHLAERRVNGSECIDCRAVRLKDWKSRNAGRVVEHFRLYYTENAERLRAKARDYGKRITRDPALRAKRATRFTEAYKAHPERWKAATAARRAAKAAAAGSHTAADVRRLRKAQGDRCVYCRASLRGKGHLDHIVPLRPRPGFAAGTNDPDNLQLLCQPCNLSKHNKDPVVFAQELGFLL